MRAVQKDATLHLDRFAHAQHRQFLRAVCGRLGERGVAKVFTLKIGEIAVASRVAFQLPECLYLYYSGVDPAWSKYSVGTTIVAEIIKLAIARGVPRIHLSMGSDLAKSRWRPKMPRYHEGICVRPTVASKAALTLYAWGRNNPILDRTVGQLLPKRRFE
jgi:CelD/BcsL family acetyltransferase involved in cellulose biosynthesis